MNSESSKMRNDIEQARRKKQRERRHKKAKRWALIMAAVLLVAVLIVVLPATTLKDISDFFVSTLSSGEFPVTVSNLPADDVLHIDGGFCVRNGGRIAVVNSSGSLLQQIDTGYPRTGIVAKDNKLITFSVNGNSASLYNRTQKLYDFSTAKPILGAAIGGGRTALLTASDRYAGELEVYNSSGNREFTWFCAEGYPYLVSFNEWGSRVCVAALYIENGLFKTGITVIDTKKAAEIYNCRLDSTVVALYASGDRVIAITENNAVLIDEKGNTAVTADFDGRPVVQVADYEGELFSVLLAYEGHAELTRILVYDSELKEICRINPSLEIDDMAIWKDSVYLLADSTVTAYTTEGTLANKTSTSISASSITVPSSGKVIVIVGGKAERLED